MNIFISYASEDRSTADALAVRLRTEEHEVFLDRDDLPEGDAYDDRIREAVASCDLYLFLVTPLSIQPGRYTMTELKFARERFPNPRGRVLPVLIEPTPFSDIPPYLSAVTVLQPQGNAIAETVAEVGRMQGRTARKRLLRLGAAALAMILIAAVLVWWDLAGNGPPCRLSATLIGEGTGLALDITTPQGTSALPMSAGATPLELGPFEGRDTPWSLMLRGRDGSALGERGLSGCPGTRIEVDFGDGNGLVLEPR